MTEKSKFYGYEIQRNTENDEWVFTDTLEPTISTYQKRPCGMCGLFKTEDDHDACIANLPNVINACCGHGNVDEAYIQFENGSELRGSDVENWVNEFKLNQKA